MRSTHLAVTTGLILALALAPSPARADTFLSPIVGAPFGGDLDDPKLAYGLSFGFMGGRVVGLEFDFAYTPNFFEPEHDPFDLVGDNNLVSGMVNLIVGAPLGVGAGELRPYVSGGAGVMRSHVRSAGDLVRITNSDVGTNVGAGAMAFFSQHVGLRGDVRYFRALGDPDEDNEFDIAFGDFDFWRAVVGVTFRW
jgi:hypothetical protein